MRAYQPGERTWQERSSAHIEAFLAFHPFACQHEHAEQVLTRCAELTWELQPSQPRWSALSITEAFRRLAIEHEFFPQPALLVAHYDVLHLFVPWLALQHLIPAQTRERLFQELMAVKAPLVDEARQQQRLRDWDRRRHGAWYEVLKTMSG